MTTATGPTRPEPDLYDRLRTADEVEHQLSEHWQLYAAVQDQLDDLRSTRDSLRRLASGVNAVTGASTGIVATLASLIETGGAAEAEDDWGSRMLTLASDAVGEILLNTAMHSQATSTTAGLKRHAGWLLVSLSDNGVGGASFTPDGELSRVRTRIREAGGMISLDSDPGTGTTVTFALPLVPPASDASA